MTETKIQGMWWISDNPKNKVSGNLSIKDKRLELNGCFDGIKNTESGSTVFIDIQEDLTILGVSRTGAKEYTLEFDRSPIGGTFSIPGYRSETYALRSIWTGVHFLKPSDASFSVYHVEFSHLFEWMGQNVFDVKHFIIGNAEKKADITVKKIKPINIFQNNDIKVSYVISAAPLNMVSTKEIDLSQTGYLRIESLKKELTLPELYSIVSHLERFLTIATGEAVSPISYQAFIDSKKMPKLIQLFPNGLQKKEYKPLHPGNMNFLFSDIEKDCQTIFEKWFSQQEKHKDVFNLFSVINSDSQKNLNNQFKDIVGAIEGFIRVEKNAADMNLDGVIKEINTAIPVKQRLLMKTDYKKIRITRNKLSHLTIKPEDEKFILNEKERWVYFEKLKILLEYSFLKNMGMGDDLLASFLEKKIKFIPVL